jgi:hypothetical protein
MGNKKVETNKSWQQAPGTYIAPTATKEFDMDEDQQIEQPPPSHFGFLDQLSSNSDNNQKMTQQSDDLMSFSASNNSEKKELSFSLKDILKKEDTNKGNIIYPQMDKKMINEIQDTINNGTIDDIKIILLAEWIMSQTNAVTIKA